jgi:hypothetical protein
VGSFHKKLRAGHGPRRWAGCHDLGGEPLLTI